MVPWLALAPSGSHDKNLQLASVDDEDDDDDDNDDRRKRVRPPFHLVKAVPQLTCPELEPGISGSGGRRLIH